MTRRQARAAASWAAAFAPSSDGIAIAEIMPIIATTIKSSISENPRCGLREYIKFNKAKGVCLNSDRGRFEVLVGTLSRTEGASRQLRSVYSGGAVASPNGRRIIPTAENLLQHFYPKLNDYDRIV